MAISFTGTPVWFKLPPFIAGDLIPDYANYSYPPGPYDYGGNQFWIVYELDYLIGGYTISAYKSIDNAKTQPLTRITSGISDPVASYLNTYWDGSSRFAYCTFVIDGGIGVNKAIKTMTFDLQLGVFSAINDPSVTVGNDFSDAMSVPLSNGNIILVWDLASTPQMKAKLYSGGVWGGVVVLAAEWLLNIFPVANNKVGIWSAPILGVVGVNTVSYSVFDGVAVSAALSLGVPNPLLDFGPWPCLYDSVHDTAICSIPEAPTEVAGSMSAQTVFSVSPSSGGGGVITRTVIDTNPGVTLERELQFIGANQTYTTFYAMVDQGKPNGANAQLFLYTAPAITGPWSGQSVFYNQNTNNSVPAGFFTPPPPLIYAYSFRLLANGTIGFTMQFAANMSGSQVSVVAGITPAPAPVINPGPGTKKKPTPKPNPYDWCLHREYRLYCSLNVKMITCGSIPACFSVDERDWAAGE